MSDPISSPSYSLPSTGSGGPAVADGAQYLVQTSSARLGGGTWVYQLQSPVDVSAVDGNGNPIFTLIQTGDGAIQCDKPAPSTGTLTISITQP